LSAYKVAVCRCSSHPPDKGEAGKPAGKHGGFLDSDVPFHQGGDDGGLGHVLSEAVELHYREVEPLVRLKQFRRHGEPDERVRKDFTTVFCVKFPLAHEMYCNIL